MKSLKRVFRFVRPYRWQALLAMLLITGMVVVDLAIPRLTQVVIDDGVATRDIGVIVRTSLLMVLASVFSALFAIANTIISVRVGQNTTADIRSALVRKVQSFSFGNLLRIRSWTRNDNGREGILIYRVFLVLVLPGCGRDLPLLLARLSLCRCPLRFPRRF